MATEHQNMASLIDRDVMIAVKRDGAQSHAKLKIFIGCCQPSSLHNKKELHIRLTDENDPFFLQFLYLGEDDFQSLKTQQGLLVDFSAFPQKLIDLIELCCKEEQSPNPRFLLQFSVSGLKLLGNGQLDIVETNPFKHLIHLSLKFLPGNDEEIKKYLAGCIKHLKENKVSLEEKLSNLEAEFATTYSRLDHQLRERTTELDDLKSQWTIKLNDASSKHLAELSSVKEQEIHLQNSYEGKLKTERKEWEEKYHRTVSKLEDKIAEIDLLNKDLLEKRYKTESTIRELKSRNYSLEEECRRTNKEIQTLRRQNSNLDSDRHERDKTLNHLRTRVAVLEQELKDKEQVIARSAELMETSKNQRTIFEEEMRGKSSQINKLETTVKSVSDEVIKGNEIIQKLQNELRNLKSQLKLKNIVTTKQERILEEKDDILLNNKKEIEGLNKQLVEKTQETQKTSDELIEAKQKLEESQELAKTNENVINWLNKQLNDQMLGPSKYLNHDTTTTTIASSTSSRLPSMRSVLHHSTPSSGYVSTASVPGGRNFQNQIPNQVRYRPPAVGNPPTWQSPPSSDHMTIGKPSTALDRRPPLKQRMPTNQPIAEQNEPVVDMKYLQRRAREPAQNRVRNAENSENVEEDARNRRTVKPLLVSPNDRRS